MYSSADQLSVATGTLLFAEGDEGTSAYLIKSGRIAIFVTRDGRDLQLVERGPGEIVGEMALIDNLPRSASARVIAACELSVVTKDQLGFRIAHTDPILRMCLGVVIDRYRQSVAMLDHASAGPAPLQPVNPLVDFEAALKVLTLENELRRAVAFGELELFFQPIVRLADRGLAGFEALIRWNHPQRGLVGPVEFIPIAEASGLILDITSWCMAEAGRIFPLLEAAAGSTGGEPLFLSINVSGHDLTHASFLPRLAAVIAENGLRPDSIKLEVTESVLMTEPVKAAAVLAECRALGLNVAIDDFGTGYSSLSHLSSLPITTIKIDKSFVSSMLAVPTSRKIIHMILRLAAELDIPVVAEGIEGEREAAELDALGCRFGQGYLFSRPQPLDRTLALARQWRRVPDETEDPRLVALCA